MQVLFVHKNFPGQFLHLAPAMAARGHKVYALAINKHPAPENVTVALYPPPPTQPASGARIHAWCADFERNVSHGEVAAEAAFELRKIGVNPDVICAHEGWGGPLYIKDVWPKAKLLTWFEFYYKPYGGFMSFDPEFTPRDAPKLPMYIRTRNASTLLNLENADRGISATHFQKSVFPMAFHQMISVCHEGIDTHEICPDPAAIVNLPNGVSLSKRDEVVTFVSRDLEPVRGYHQFMRALPGILKHRPRARVLIVGGSGVSYGSPPPSGKSWRDIYYAEVKDRVDESRIHFLGTQPREVLTKILQVSSVHVYLTYPHVLSWSCLEAMSCGAVVVGSATEPVMEVVEHEKNGLLVDFFSTESLVAAVCGVFEHPSRMSHLGIAARKTIVSRFDLKTVCLPRQIEIIESIVGGNAA